MLESDDENEIGNKVDYPSDEMTSSESDDSDNSAQGDNTDIGNGGGDALQPQRQRRRRTNGDVHMLDTGWSKTSFTPVDSTFNPGAVAGRKIGPEITCANCRGPKNRPIDKRAVCDFTLPRTAVVR